MRRDAVIILSLTLGAYALPGPSPSRLPDSKRIFTPINGQEPTLASNLFTHLARIISRAVAPPPPIHIQLRSNTPVVEPYYHDSLRVPAPKPSTATQEYQPPNHRDKRSEDGLQPHTSTSETLLHAPIRLPPVLSNQEDIRLGRLGVGEPLLPLLLHRRSIHSSIQDEDMVFRAEVNRQRIIDELRKNGEHGSAKRSVGDKKEKRGRNSRWRLRTMASP